jgi:hypothetical protein
MRLKPNGNFLYSISAEAGFDSGSVPHLKLEAIEKEAASPIGLSF